MYRARYDFQHFRATVPTVVFFCSSARNIVRLLMEEARVRGEQICYPYVPGTMTFGVSEKRILVPQPVGYWVDRRQLY